MNEKQIIYQGRIVSKKNFRVYVYGVNGKKLLVNSYPEFKQKIASGDWFESISDVVKSTQKTVEVKEKPDVEIKDDSFVANAPKPKGREKGK